MNKKGFTLAELLAVIAILAILVLIAIPNVMQLYNESKKETFTTELKLIVKAARNQWMNESMFETNEKVYARCKSGTCPNQLNLSGRKELEYYVKMNKNGNITKLYATDGSYQYQYSGSGLKIEDIESVVEISKISMDNIVEISCFGFGRNAVNTILKDSTLVDIADAKRYVGTNPNNYVSFNNELWRIIGIYNDRLKIIKSDSQYSIQYNTYEKQWDNDWDQSTVNNWLKNEYYNSLSSIAKEMIDVSSWNIGKANGDENAGESYNKSKLLTWNGTVGTIAAYEFLYASFPSSCYLVSGHNYSGGTYCGRNWLASNSISITMTAYEDNQHLACFLYGGNYPSIGVSGVQNTLTIRPTVYLKSNIMITDGDGTINAPYTLSLD